MLTKLLNYFRVTRDVFRNEENIKNHIFLGTVFSQFTVKLRPLVVESTQVKDVSHSLLEQGVLQNGTPLLAQFIIPPPSALPPKSSINLPSEALKLGASFSSREMKVLQGVFF